MALALGTAAIVLLALLWELAPAAARRRRLARHRVRSLGAQAHGVRDGAMTRVASAAPSSARARCCARASTRRTGRCIATSASCACGAAPASASRILPPRPGSGHAVPTRAHRTGGRTCAEASYAYLIYPHKPIVAYLPQTGALLNEYCVAFPDHSRPYGSARLPDSDDVLAKWMALTADERRLIADANMHLPGRQIDPERVRRDLLRLARWERERGARRADSVRAA